MAGVSEVDFLEAVANDAAAEASSDAVAHIIKEAAMAVEKSRLRRAFNDYDRIQRVKVARQADTSAS